MLRQGCVLSIALIFVVVFGACGGSSPTTTPPPSTTLPPPTTAPPAPATLADLSAAVTSPQTDASLNCRDDVRARVTLTNRSGSRVGVLGIRNTTGVPAGNCLPGDDFTFRPLTGSALPNSTTVVLEESLYDGPNACCDGSGCAGSCRFQQAFTVITDVGEVPAGVFNYRVFFQNCGSCAGVSTAGERTCRPPAVAVP